MGVCHVYRVTADPAGFWVHENVGFRLLDSTVCGPWMVVLVVTSSIAASISDC